MKLTSRSELGLKAMIELARASELPESSLSVAEIAGRCEASNLFLAQVMLHLKSHGLVRSRRGRAGGYQLSRSPREITVGEVLRALDTQIGPAPCANSEQYVRCDWCENKTGNCQLTSLWREVSAATSTILNTRTLATFLDAAASSDAQPAARLRA